MKLKTIPDEIGKLQNLKDLNLYGTAITGLPEGVFELPLKSLNIGNCKKLPLDVIDTICQKLSQLESLDLSGLEMTALPPSIGDCTALTSLNLRSCKQLKSLPEGVFELPLKFLNIGYCKKLPLDVI